MVTTTEVNTPAADITTADITVQPDIMRVLATMGAASTPTRSIAVAGIINWRPIAVVTAIRPVSESTTGAGITDNIIAAPRKGRERARERQPAVRQSVIGRAVASCGHPRRAHKRTAIAGSEEDGISTPTLAIVTGTATLTTAPTGTTTAGVRDDSCGCAFPTLAGCSFRAGQRSGWVFESDVFRDDIA